MSNRSTTPAEIAFLIYRDSTGRLGNAIEELGGLWRRVGAPILNSSRLFTALFPSWSPIEAGPPGDAQLAKEALDAIDRQTASLALAEPGDARGRLAAEELIHMAALARIGARIIARDHTLEISDVDIWIEAQRLMWMRTSRPGGLADSLANLEDLRRWLSAQVEEKSAELEGSSD